MKVLQINTVYKTGSTGRIVSDLNDLILKEDWESYVGYGRGDWKDKNTIKIGNKTDMYLHGLGTRIFDKHGLYSKKATVEFIEKIDKINIDVFHLHNIHGYYLNYPILFDYLKDKKVIWTLHDCWAYTGHCAYYDYAECSKWQNKCNVCPQKTAYPASFIFDNSCQNFNLKKKYFTQLKDLTIVTPSNWLAEEVKKSFLKDYKIEVIHNGIDIEIFKPVKSGFREKYNLEDRFIVLGVANIWEKRKGLEYFLELSKKLDDEYKIILVGLNSKQLKTLPKNILGFSKTDSVDELVKIYSSADVLLNPTLEDNFPTVNLESLACGTPVVTFDTGGSPESIDENTGYVAKKNNLIGLINSIKRIRVLKKNHFSKYCRKKAIIFFNKEKNLKQYISLYNRRVE